MSNVTPIRSNVLTQEREPDPEVIRHLDELLNMARSGELIGITGAVLYFDGLAGRVRVGKVGFSSLGACQSALFQATKELLEG